MTGAWHPPSSWPLSSHEPARSRVLCVPTAAPCAAIRGGREAGKREAMNDRAGHEDVGADRCHGLVRQRPAEDVGSRRRGGELVHQLRRARRREHRRRSPPPARAPNGSEARLCFDACQVRRVTPTDEVVGLARAIQGGAAQRPRAARRRRPCRWRCAASGPSWPRLPRRVAAIGGDLVLELGRDLVRGVPRSSGAESSVMLPHSVVARVRGGCGAVPLARTEGEAPGRTTNDRCRIPPLGSA